MTQATVVSPKPSALDALRALGQKKPVATSPALSAQNADPAIAGAKRDKNTVKLGFDPGFSERAAYGAALKHALERATSDFEVAQAELRDYGKKKRAVYNDAFKANVTTVCVPFSVEVPGGHETRYVQVVCSNKYSVVKDMVLNNQAELGEWFGKLFTVETVKKLKPNAEELVRNLFSEMGLQGDDLEASMAALFDTEHKVSTKEDFEQASSLAPPEVKAILEQAVTRAQPGLKF